MAAESERLRTLRSYDVLDTPPEQRLDDLARAAAAGCATPIALVSLVDHDRQFFKAHVGLGIDTTPRPGSFCSHAIESDLHFEVPDASGDPRFRGHSLVKHDPHVRFYAAAPLIGPARAAIGTLCVLDYRPRTLTGGQRELLQILGRQVMGALDDRQKDLLRARVQRALDRDLRAQIEGIARDLGKLQGPPQTLLSMMLGTDDALRTVDDAVEVLGGLALQPRAADLAVVCQELVASYQEHDRPPLFVSAAGDCTGSWDVDRLTGALAALVDRAEGGPASLSVRGGQEGVTISVRAPALDLDGGLHLEAALQIIRLHGGQVERTTGPSDVSVAVWLPRAPV